MPILLVTGWFNDVDRFGITLPDKVFLTSHGIDLITDKVVITPNEPPERLGAKFDQKYMEWIIE